MARGGRHTSGICGAVLAVACGSEPLASDATSGSTSAPVDPTNATTAPPPPASTSGADDDGTSEGDDEGSSSGGGSIAACPAGEPMPRPTAIVPNVEYPADMHGQPLSPTLAYAHHNQPTVLDGYLMLAGNATFSTWDITDAAAPVLLADFASER